MPDHPSASVSKSHAGSRLARARIADRQTGRKFQGKAGLSLNGSWFDGHLSCSAGADLVRVWRHSDAASALSEEPSDPDFPRDGGRSDWHALHVLWSSG